jgi:hypothetical protein
MTDTTEDLELFDDAKEAFPAKEDLKDRLCLIWVTGKHGIRKGTDVGARPYPWYETVTLVIDDGPDWDGTKIVDGEKQENLVPSVAENGPQELDGFQHTTSGLTSRLSQRVITGSTQPVINGEPVADKPKTFKPMLGRINSRKNKTQGRSPSWSISEPTEDDKVTARMYAAQIKAISERLSKPPAPASDEEAFE